MALIDIPQYRSELAEIRKSLLAAGDALHIDHIREQLDELTEEMNQPEFWNDPDHSAKVNQKVSNLKGKLEHYEKLLSSADDIEVMLEMAEEEKDEDTVTEAVNELATLKEHDNIHSIFVDQWDWEKIITPKQRTMETLQATVRAIYLTLRK